MTPLCISVTMSIVEQGTREWRNDLFGCLGDFRLCIVPFLVPCYTIGKNGEALGEDCLLIGALALFGLPLGPVMRWRIRQDKDIKGSMIMDTVCWIFCGYCALCQEARELGWQLPFGEAGGSGGGQAGAAKPQDMTRQ